MSEATEVPDRVSFWISMVRMAQGTRVSPPNDSFVRQMTEHAEERLRRAIRDAIAGAQTDPEFLRVVAGRLAGDDAERLVRIAAVIERDMTWVDQRVPADAAEVPRG